MAEGYYPSFTTQDRGNFETLLSKFNVLLSITQHVDSKEEGEHGSLQEPWLWLDDFLQAGLSLGYVVSQCASDVCTLLGAF